MIDDHLVDLLIGFRAEIHVLPFQLSLASISRMIKDVIMRDRALTHPEGQQAWTTDWSRSAYFLVLRFTLRSWRRADAATDLTAFNFEVLSNLPAIRPTRLEVAT
jgi:hypothetical protein